MPSYLSALWARLTGATEQQGFLDSLRPRRVLQTPRRLPSTPTRSHLPPARSEVDSTGVKGKKSKQCPHCRKCFYLELPGGRISKPKKPRSKGTKGKGKRGKRWVNVDDAYRVEDMSPTLAVGFRGKGVQSAEAREERYQNSRPATGMVVKAGVGPHSIGGRQPRRMNVSRGPQ